MSQASVVVLDGLNPEICKYPCDYLQAGRLPLPVIDGYEHQSNKNIIRSQMDIGLMTMRRRARAVPVNFKLKFQFTGEQKEVFESMIDNELDGGIEWFYIPVRTGDYDLEVHKVRFNEVPGEDVPFRLVSVGQGMGSRWETTPSVHGFRAKLERYAARVLSLDSLAGIERAAVRVQDVP